MDLERSDFYDLLESQAEFLKLKPTTKVPAGSFSPGRRNRYKKIPKEGNYGVIPQKKLFILDIDTRKGDSVKKQLELFSKLLKSNISKTFTVKTPAGGVHCYLFLPLNETFNKKNFPKMNLRGFQEEISEITGLNIQIDADIRSTAANAYVVGPGSETTDGNYEVLKNLPILEIASEGLNNLLLIVEKKREKKRLSKNNEKRFIDLWADETPIEGGVEPIRELPPTEVINGLQSIVRKDRYETFHQKRAFVYIVLKCCYSKDAIVKTCRELGLDKDSATGEKISFYLLQKDIVKLNFKVENHSRFCPVGREKMKNSLKKKSTKTFEDYAEAQRNKIETKNKSNFSPKINPKVVDIQKIHEALITKNNRLTNQYKQAMAIVEVFLQPLSNTGVRKIILSKEKIKKDLGLTDSQAIQAVRILRDKGVIELSGRPVPGVAPKYFVNSSFTHLKMTTYLRKSWAATKEADDANFLVYSPRDRGFCSAVSQEVVFTNKIIEAIAEKDSEILSRANKRFNIFSNLQLILIKSN
jgi:hypothetical protein